MTENEEKRKKFSFNDPTSQLVIVENITLQHKDNESLSESQRGHIEDKLTKETLEISDKKLAPIHSLSKEEKQRLEGIIEKKASSVDERLYTIPFQEVAHAIETILSEQKEQILPNFFKDINPPEEFGVSRFVADRMSHLSKLLESTTLSFIQDSTYLVSAEVKDSRGNSIKLEHRFKATNDKEAKNLYEKIAAQLAGIQQKIWLSCWRLANELRRFTFTCHLTDLMKIAYPERDSYFSVPSKTEFYDHLKSLEQTKFAFSCPQKQKKNGKTIYQTFEIPLLQILGRIGGEEDKYPNQLTLSIMNLQPNPGKMAYRGAAFKNKTLELHADDTSLASWIQTRKAQKQKDAIITVERSFLIQLAGLKKTDRSNKTVANKKLLAKLQRLHEKGILAEAPSSIQNIISLVTQ